MTQNTKLVDFIWFTEWQNYLRFTLSSVLTCLIPATIRRMNVHVKFEPPCGYRKPGLLNTYAKREISTKVQAHPPPPPPPPPTNTYTHNHTQTLNKLTYKCKRKHFNTGCTHTYSPTYVIGVCFHDNVESALSHSTPYGRVQRSDFVCPRWSGN